MARQRMLKPEFFTDADLLSLSPLHRLLFQGLWCLADREGRLLDQPRNLKIRLLPADFCDVNELLNDLAELGMVQRYEVDGVRYLVVKSFHKHQHPHPHEAKSEIPPPPGQRRSVSGERTSSRGKPSNVTASNAKGVTCPSESESESESESDDLSTCPEEDPDLPAPDVPPTGFPQTTAPDASAPGGTPAAHAWVVWQSARVDRGLERERHPPDGWESWYLKHAEVLGEAKLDAVFERYLNDPWSRDVGPNGRRRDASVRLLMADGDQVLIERLLQLEAEPVAPRPAPPVERPKTRWPKIVEVPDGMTEEQALAQAREDGDGRHLRPDPEPPGGAP